MDIDSLRENAEQALSRLRGRAADDDLAKARLLALALRDERQFALLARLTEALSRRCPGDARTRRLHAQALIEQGCATAAIDVLKPLAARLPKDDPEYVEATGLLGRAYKQIFFDAGDKTDGGARDALKRAITIYRKPFEDDEANTWHGVNLLALVTRARRIGLRLAPDIKTDQLASRLVARLEAVPEAARDAWYLPTLAEASLGLDDWKAVEAALKRYVADPDVRPFQVASTLRQFTEVWDIESTDDRGRALVNILRARLLALSRGELVLSSRDLQAARAVQPEKEQLEAVLGELGTQTYQWYRTGLARAAGVCAVRHRMGTRIGTGWLVQARDLGLDQDEFVVVTNAHVVSDNGALQSIVPDAAEIGFETVAPDKSYGVQRILASSPPDRHDYSILRLSEPVGGIEPLPLAKNLPLIAPSARVYVIGHPGGRELEFSMQDNELLDHEGPTTGKPAIEGVWRVHYRAPTEGGSSGSPVFNARYWEVIALHHKGGKTGMTRLNGKPGTYAANEGIAIQSIRADIGKVPI
ncbi:MAG: serine protease [Burkholderiaceae bacterium]